MYSKSLWDDLPGSSTGVCHIPGNQHQYYCDMNEVGQRVISERVKDMGCGNGVSHKYWQGVECAQPGTTYMCHCHFMGHLNWL